MCIPSAHIHKYIAGCKIKVSSDAFFERPYSWHDLVNNLPSRTATAPICFRKNVCSTIFHENLFQKKVPLYFRGDTMPLFCWKNHVGLHVSSVFASKWIKFSQHIGFDKNEDCMTEKVSWLRHYKRIGVLSVQTPFGAPGKLNLLVKYFLIFK